MAINHHPFFLFYYDLVLLQMSVNPPSGTYFIIMSQRLDCIIYIHIVQLPLYSNESISRLGRSLESQAHRAVEGRLIRTNMQDKFLDNEKNKINNDKKIK